MKDLLIELAEELQSIAEDYDTYAYRGEFDDEYEAFLYFEDAIINRDKSVFSYLDIVKEDDNALSKRAFRLEQKLKEIW